MHQCTECGTTYATLNESGEHVCPNCGNTDELFDVDDLLPVKIGSFDDITDVLDAEEYFRLWLNGYGDAQGGGNYIVHHVEIRKSLDGWYALLTSPPQLKE